MTEPQTFTINEAARYKGCSSRTIRRAIKDGAIQVLILNPNDPPQRWVVQVPKAQLDNWTPRKYRKSGV